MKTDNNSTDNELIRLRSRAEHELKNPSSELPDVLRLSTAETQELVSRYPGQGLMFD